MLFIALLIIALLFIALLFIALLIINPRRMREGYGTCSVINPRPEGYGSCLVVHSLTLGRRVTVVVLSFVRSFIHSVHRATESSVHFFAPVKV